MERRITAQLLRIAAGAFWSDVDKRTDDEKHSALLAACVDFDNDHKDGIPIGTLTRLGDETIAFTPIGDPHIKNGMPVFDCEVDASDALSALTRTPNPSGEGTMSNYHIMLMAISALRSEGHHTLASEMEAIQKHQQAVVVKSAEVK